MMRNFKWEFVIWKITWRNRWIFTLTTWNKSQNLQLIFSKLRNVRVKKLESSLVWWKWTVMQNLIKNWLVVSKTTFEIDNENWWISLSQVKESKCWKSALWWASFVQSMLCSTPGTHFQRRYVMVLGELCKVLRKQMTDYLKLLM